MAKAKQIKVRPRRMIFPRSRPTTAVKPRDGKVIVPNRKPIAT